MDKPLSVQVQETLIREQPSSRITDLYIWRVGKSHNASVVSISTDEPVSPDQVKDVLIQHHELKHVTVEINLE